MNASFTSWVRNNRWADGGYSRHWVTACNVALVGPDYYGLEEGRGNTYGDVYGEGGGMGGGNFTLEDGNGWSPRDGA